MPLIKYHKIIPARKIFVFFFSLSMPSDITITDSEILKIKNMITLILNLFLMAVIFKDSIKLFRI